MNFSSLKRAFHQALCIVPFLGSLSLFYVPLEGWPTRMTTTSETSVNQDQESNIRTKKKKGQFSCCFGLCECGHETEECYLYAFDFDHTIIDKNSDNAIVDIIHNPIPPQLNRKSDGSNWEEYMDGIFRFVAEEGGTYDVIAQKLCKLQPTEGMPHLLHKIVLARAEYQENSKLVIISDANTFFIETFLWNLKPPVVPDKMLTNKAEMMEGGRLKLRPFEYQVACPFCPRNLCKGAALMNYIATEGPFERVFYTGDGGNDVCPAVKLTERDIVFVRRNYAMDKIIRSGTWKGQEIEIRAKVIFWDSAGEIEDELPL